MQNRQLQHCFSRFQLVAALVFACLVVMTDPLTASTLQSGKDIHISNLHEIDDDLYVFCEKLNIDGSISGDLLAFIYRCEINGELGQSASVFSRTMINRGRINGSLRAFSERLTQDGHIRGSLMSLGSVTELSKSSVIERDVHAFGGEINIDGVINGNLVAKGKDVVLSGLIEGDVDIECEKLAITSPLVVRGNLTYKAKEEIDFEGMAGVNIIGEVNYSVPEEEHGDDGNIGVSIVYKTADILGTFLLGLLAVVLFRAFSSRSIHELKSRTTISAAVGLLALVVFLFFIVVLLFSATVAAVGGAFLADSVNAGGLIMVGIALLVLPVSALVSMAGIFLVYAGKIIIALWIGSFLIKLKDNLSSHLFALFVGLVILTILYVIPYLGNLIWLAVSILGAGAAVLGAKNCGKILAEQS